MYSKYVEYGDAAYKAHQANQVENEQKDILISQLKSEVYELKQIEGDFRKLNDLVASLEDKYSLLLDEKQRSDREQKVKSDIDKNTVLQLRAQIDALKIQLQKAAAHIEDLIRDNTSKKRLSDARAQQVQSLHFELKELDNKNQRSHQQNKSQALNLKGLKDERKRLEEQCDLMSSILDKNIAELKALQKQVRTKQSNNSRLDKILHQAQNDNSKLLVELKQKNDDAKRAQTRLNSLKGTLAEMQLSYQGLQQQANKHRQEMERNRQQLGTEVTRGKDLSAKLASVQASIRAQQSQLDLIMDQQQKLRRQHFACLERNKHLNGQIDRMLALISEYQQVNRQLLDQIEIYIDQDQQARAVLNRKDAMRQIIQGTLRKVALTGEHIKHLKY